MNEQLAPELVYDGVRVEGDETNYLGVDYEGFIPLLINKCQQQDRRIKELNDRVNKLESMIEKLNDELRLVSRLID